MNADGSVDTSFGNAGKFVSAVDAGSQQANAITVDPSDRVILAVSYAVAGVDFGAIRLTQAGVPDPTFGDGGVALTDFAGRDDEPFAVVLQTDGKLVIAGDGLSQGSPPDTAIQIARLSPIGAVDPSFATSGKALTLPMPNTSYGVSGAAITGCGIVAVGTWGYNLSTVGDDAMGVAKYRR